MHRKPIIVCAPDSQFHYEFQQFKCPFCKSSPVSAGWMTHNRHVHGLSCSEFLVQKR